MKLNERQKERLMSHLSAHARDEALKVPVKALSQLLLNDFGVPTSTGREAVKTFLNEMECSGKILCTYNDRKRSLLTVRVVIPNVVLETLPTPQVNPETTVSMSAHSLPLRKKGRHRTPKALERGEVRRIRLANEKGDRNENRCFRIASRLVKLLKLFFQEKIISAECTRSGRHNPKKGKIDIADHCGEDVGIALAARLDESTVTSGRIIHNAKSSEWMAQQFNRTIRLGKYEVETNVRFKGAIVVNDKRSDLEIAKELLENIVKAGFSFVTARKEAVLQEFRSF